MNRIKDNLFIVKGESGTGLTTRAVSGRKEDKERTLTKRIVHAKKSSEPVGSGLASAERGDSKGEAPLVDVPSWD